MGGAKGILNSGNPAKSSDKKFSNYSKVCSFGKQEQMKSVSQTAILSPFEDMWKQAAKAH